MKKLHCLAETQVENDNRFFGFYPLSEKDAVLFQNLLRGEFIISKITARNLRQLFVEKTQDR